ncbi:hypothetical protein OG592_42200 (plasmid) [Streptomyces avidinii]|uniref:hypothetical protein n=1 Tax=Streptomyces avidinii TaxID=1895 RepID=UPI003864AE6D|nr:hypothetical protein OG592_42200 [Streptomyces avidinii]
MSKLVEFFIAPDDVVAALVLRDGPGRALEAVSCGNIDPEEADSEPGSTKINVLAKVHMHNIPSQKMLARAEFQQKTTGTPAKPLGW